MTKIGKLQTHKMLMILVLRPIFLLENYIRKWTFPLESLTQAGEEQE